jgi:serine/threonine protein kinase
MSTPQLPNTELPTVRQFLETVLRSRLLEKDRLRAAVKAVPRPLRHDAAAVADFLVRGGLLSRFQASRLLKGLALGLVLGPYQVLAPLGRGGMGSVFMARDERSGQLVALKLLTPKRAREEERIKARFLREMRLSQQVAHPHLCWTFEAGECHRVLYIAMEYIPGKNLAKLVRDEGPLRYRRAARLISEAAAGLEHAHNAGLIHRDMKPSNIMVTPHDHAKVLDLGLAIIHGEKVEDHFVVGGQGYIVGTMDYISPEQTTDAAGVDRRSDIYSLGCTLYFALTGQPPFPGGTHKDKIRRHRSGEPQRVEDLCVDLPAGFGNVVRKMMARSLEERYPSAIAVAEELRAWAVDEPVLPLDRPEDAEYTEAVNTLQQSVPSTEFSIPSLALPDPLEERTGDRKGSWWRWLVPVLLAAGIVLAVAVILALLLLARHENP